MGRASTDACARAERRRAATAALANPRRELADEPQENQKRKDRQYGRWAVVLTACEEALGGRVLRACRGDVSREVLPDVSSVRNIPADDSTDHTQDEQHGDSAKEHRDSQFHHGPLLDVSDVTTKDEQQQTQNPSQ